MAPDRVAPDRVAQSLDAAVHAVRHAALELDAERAADADLLELVNARITGVVTLHAANAHGTCTVCSEGRASHDPLRSIPEPWPCRTVRIIQGMP